MTLRTRTDLAGRRHLVRIPKREPGAAVIEHAVRPGRDRMAGCARGCTGREIGRNVVGHATTKSLRAVPCRLVTA